MKKLNFKRAVTSSLFIIFMTVGGFHQAEAKKQMISSNSWADANGCIWIIEVYQHSFLGINLWQSESLNSVNC